MLVRGRLGLRISTGGLSGEWWEFDMVFERLGGTGRGGLMRLEIMTMYGSN